MIDWVRENATNIVLGVGVLAILMWPQIKAGLALLNGSEPEDKPKGDTHCPCCCLPEDQPPEKTRSEWTTEVISIRTYCEQRRLPEAVEACDTLIKEIVSGKPQPMTAGVSVTKVSKA